MTTLAQLAWDCREIQGTDKLVLMGWLEQVPDGSDVACASKETVADFIGLGISTVKRHTKALVKRGVLIATGGKKEWKFGWTAVYQVNLELLAGTPSKLNPPINSTPVQIEPQGYRFTGLSSPFLDSPTASLIESMPQERAGESKDAGKPENLEPKTLEPKPFPSPHGHKKAKVCPECGEPLQRDVNHFLVCKATKGNSTLDEYLGDMPTYRPADLNSIGGGLMDFDENGHYESSPFARKAEEARRQRVEAERQKEIESILAGGRTRATANAFHGRPLLRPPPPRSRMLFIPCKGKESGCTTSIRDSLWAGVDGWCPECIAAKAAAPTGANEFVDNSINP
jgi:hypothetical protein